MGACTSQATPPKEIDAASPEQASKRVAVPLEDLTAKIRKLEEENRELKQQVALLNSRPAHEPVSSPLKLMGVDKTHAFAQSFSALSALRSPTPPSPPSRIPPDPDEFYENYVIPSPSNYFRSLKGNEPNTSFDNKQPSSPMFALHSACSPLPTLISTTTIINSSPDPSHETTTSVEVPSTSSTSVEVSFVAPTAAPAPRLSQATTVTITSPTSSLSPNGMPIHTVPSRGSPTVKPSSTPYPNTPPLAASERRLSAMSSLNTRRKSSASLSAGTAAAAAALAASPGLLSPVSRSSPSPSLRTIHTNSPSRPLSLAVDAEREEEVYDEGSPSKTRLEGTVEELDTHDELYDCSEEDEDELWGGEELPLVTAPLGRALATARESRAKLLRKSNAIEGLTRIKDAHFLNSKSKPVPTTHFTGKVLGLFLVGSNSFSRCNEVLPEVVRWEQSKTRPHFEIVLVWTAASKLDPSGTGSAAASSEYEQIRKLVPFSAAAFNSPLGVVLYEMFCHKGTPSLVIIDMDGAIINTNGLTCEEGRLRMSEDLEHFPFRPDFDKQALDLFNYIDADKAGVLTQEKILARSDNQESGEYVHEKLLLEAEGEPLTSKVWSALLLTQFKASAGQQSDMEEILDSFQDIFCYRPETH